VALLTRRCADLLKTIPQIGFDKIVDRTFGGSGHRNVGSLQRAIGVGAVIATDHALNALRGQELGCLRTSSAACVPGRIWKSFPGITFGINDDEMGAATKAPIKLCLTFGTAGCYCDLHDLAPC
jgi:hypothetical protein